MYSRLKRLPMSKKIQGFRLRLLSLIKSLFSILETCAGPFLRYSFPNCDLQLLNYMLFMAFKILYWVWQRSPRCH